MAGKSGQKRRTATEIKSLTRKLQKAIEQHKRENTSEYFFKSITPEEIKEKLKRVNSPMIISIGYNPIVPPGVRIDFRLGIFNPDLLTKSDLYAQIWVGSGYIDPVVGTFLLNVDTSFPRLTQPDFPANLGGLTLPPGASTVLGYTINVPSTAERTNYIGNICLMQVPSFRDGKFLDRGAFAFQVE